MKKNILYTAMALVVAAVGGYNVYLSQTEENLSELALANVEALAKDCEVFDSNNNLVARCSGDSNICWREKVGNGYFYCSGTKVGG